jgi:hypothetical protein
MSSHPFRPILAYVYKLPADEERVEADAIVLAYLTVFKEYPSTMLNDGALKEYAYILCRHLRSHNKMWLTNDFDLFCKFFIAYFTAAYRSIVELCNEDGGKIVQELHSLLDDYPQELVLDFLRHLVLNTVRQGSRV